MSNDDYVSLVEQAISILDTLYESGDICELPDDILNGIRNILDFSNVKNPISDPQYDLFRSWLKENSPDSDIFNQVTASTKSRNTLKIRHNPPMTSISKANGANREKVLMKWLQDCCSNLNYKSKVSSDGNPYFVQSYKRDGVAIAIYYENGVLTKAALRPRNGIDGDDVTENIKLVKGVPHKLKLPITCSLRGELECHISVFEKINSEMESKGKKTYANPRNYAAGTMQLDTPDPSRHGGIQFTCYSIEGYDNPPYKTAMERAKWVNQVLGENGEITFVRVEPFDFSSLKKLEDIVPSLDYEVDGVVIEVNNLSDAESLGREGDNDIGNPRWKLAWKFNEQTAKPIIKNIRWQTGRTLKITPVAEFDPVRLAGTNVVNVTLHNVGRVLSLGLGVGAEIEIYKSGKIIPYLYKVLRKSSNITYPDKCPSCGSNTKIEIGAGGQELVCTNLKCSAALSRSFVYYLSTFGVKGVAENVVNKLLTFGILKSYADFYKVSVDQLQKAGCTVREAILAYSNIHMVPEPEKEKDSGKLLTEAKKAAAKKKVISLNQFLASFGIPGASKGTCKDLSDKFGTIDKLLNASESDLLSVSGIGEKTAKNIYKYLIENRIDIENLLNYVEIEKPKTGILTKASGQPMVFCFTGSPDANGKEYWQKQVEDEGGRVSSCMSKKVDVCVIGADAGQKADKARELKQKGHPIQIIDDIADLRKLLGLDKNDDRKF